MLKDNYVLSSVAKYVRDRALEVLPLNVYYHLMPEKTKLPLIYFPNPIISTTSETLSSFGKQVMWYPKIIAMSPEDAYCVAEHIVMCIAGNRKQIPLLNIDGTENGEHIEISNPLISQIDNNTYQIALSWTERFLFDDVAKEDDNASNTNFTISIDKK